MSRTRILRTAIALAIVALSITPAFPAAFAASTWEREYTYFTKTASQYYSWGDDPWVTPDPVLTTCGWESCWQMAEGWVTWRITLGGPSGKSLDYVDLYVDNYQPFGGGACQYTLQRVGGGFTRDLHGQCHSIYQHRWTESIFRARNVPAGTYDFTVRCWDCSFGSYYIYDITIIGGYDPLVATLGNYRTSHEITPLRMETTIPQTCIDVYASGSPEHTTRVEIDWGDGMIETLSSSPAAYSANRCHPYPASLVNYQVCLRTLELDGLQGSVTECRDVPGGAQV